MKYRKCEICYGRSERKDGIKRNFIARFPLDEARCKKWVQVTGNEDLAYIPIEKLNQLKFICEKHFQEKDFYKKKTKLKPTAIPSIQLTRPPLSDDILLTFPCHLAREPKEQLQVPSAYRQATDTSKQATKTSSKAPKTSKQAPNTIKKATNTSRQAPNTSEQATNSSKQAPNRTSEAPIIQSTVEEPDHSFGIDLPLDDYDDNGDDAVEDCLSVSDASCQEDDDDLSFYLNLPKKSENKDGDEQVLPEPNEDLHEGFMCNNCSGEIKGYRYTCVQCPDYDLCSSCEARGAHCLHYVLRIPRPKPLTEIQPLLCEIRRLLSGEDTDVLWTQADVIKEELKEEDDPLEFDVGPTYIYEDDSIYTEDFGNDEELITPEDDTCYTEIVSSCEPDMRPKSIQKTTKTVGTILRNTPTNKKTNRRSTPSACTTTNKHDSDTVITITPPDHTKLIQVASTTTRFTASTSKTSDGNTVLTLAPQESMKRPNEVYNMSKNARVSTENPPKKLKVVFTPFEKGVEAGGLGLKSESSPGAAASTRARSRRKLTDCDKPNDAPR